MMQSTAISNPIFVVGPSRSGTTWLKCMLAVHEEFYTLPETKFYQHVLASNKRLLAKESYPRQHSELPIDITRKQLDLSIRKLCDLGFLSTDEDDELIDFFHKKIDDGLIRSDFFSCMVSFVKNKRSISGKTLVEGTPRHAIYYREILEDFPDAKFIIMERDGIDTALSAKTVYGYPFFQGLKDAYSLKKICNELYSNKSDRVISIVNYDVLQRDPGYVVNNILNKLGLSSIPQQELLDGAKDIYKEIHTWYYLNDHQPKMKGIVNKPRYPSFLKESYSHVSSKIRSNFRDYIIKKMRKYSDW